MSGLRYWPLVPRFWFSFVVNSRGVVFFFGVWERFLWGEGRVRGSGGIQNEGYNFLGFLIVLFFCSFSAQEIRTRFLCLVGTEEKEVKKAVEFVNLTGEISISLGCAACVQVYASGPCSQLVWCLCPGG